MNFKRGHFRLNSLLVVLFLSWDPVAAQDSHFVQGIQGKMLSNGEETPPPEKKPKAQPQWPRKLEMVARTEFESRVESNVYKLPGDQRGDIEKRDQRRRFSDMDQRWDFIVTPALMVRLRPPRPKGSRTDVGVRAREHFYAYNEEKRHADFRVFAEQQLGVAHEVDFSADYLPRYFVRNLSRDKADFDEIATGVRPAARYSAWDLKGGWKGELAENFALTAHVTYGEKDWNHDFRERDSRTSRIGVGLSGTVGLWKGSLTDEFSVVRTHVKNLVEKDHHRQRVSLRNEFDLGGPWKATANYRLQFKEYKTDDDVTEEDEFGVIFRATREREDLGHSAELSVGYEVTKAWTVEFGVRHERNRADIDQRVTFIDPEFEADEEEIEQDEDTSYVNHTVFVSISWRF